jgi:hypothetical protein
VPQFLVPIGPVGFGTFAPPNLNAPMAQVTMQFEAILSAAMEDFKAAMLEQMQEKISQFAATLCADYGLDHAEVEARYFYSDEAIATPKPPKKQAKKAKAESDDDERDPCAAKTAKGMPCKNKALVGFAFCACHNKAKGKEPAKVKPKGKVEESESEASSPPPKKAAKVPKAPKKAPKEHTHKMGESDEECEVCAELGDVASTSAAPGPVTRSKTSAMVDPDLRVELDKIFEQMENGGWSEEETEEETEELSSLFE